MHLAFQFHVHAKEVDFCSKNGEFGMIYVGLWIIISLLILANAWSSWTMDLFIISLAAIDGQMIIHNDEHSHIS